MTKRSVNFIIWILGVLILSMSFGLISSTPLTAKASTDTRINLKWNFKIEGSTESIPFGSTSAISTDKNDINGVTYNDLFQKGLGKIYVSGYTLYDEVNIYFQYFNSVITGKQAVNLLSNIFANPKSVPSVTDLELIKLQFSSVSNTTFDLAKVKEEANQLVIPEKVTSIDAIDTYEVTDFMLYLIRNDYTRTIKYQFADGTTASKERVVTGYTGENPAIISSPDIDGYEPSPRNVRVNFDKSGTYTTIVRYTKIDTTVPGTIDHSSLTADKTATIKSGQSISATTFHAQATDRDNNALPVTLDDSHVNYKVPGTYPVTLKAANGKTLTVTLIIKGSAADTSTVVAKKATIYGLKTFYLYQNPTFNKQERLAKYSKVPRTQRPMFVVTGYGHSKSGLLRYQVKDVNHHSRTAGKTGYITAKSTYVTAAYYQKSVKQIKVLNARGVNNYRNVTLTKRVHHLKYGQKLTVVGLERHNLTTRFVLSNGTYVTANKKLVLAIK
ncbi:MULTISPECIES: DUF5776 domain-containing protein [Lactobacillaceae]|uniref:DUF5776 domain-containing protein n=1 Tax=Lactobacillaceae TaxID=33958 RepID=UPI001457748D|nr:DUF5776 domain-containing protein [Lactobacillus sp. HBUAS51381]NLR08481.1 hypothetical protein [Lactobacillus sp. HBUAS51381]